MYMITIDIYVITHFDIESEPKITELECFGKKDGSGSIHIINKIATEFPHWKCEEFSHKLLNDQTFKMSAFKEKVAFVYELFRRWLRQPTSELSGATRRPLPRTWEVLAKCLERFDRLLAKEIRENCDKGDSSYHIIACRYYFLSFS